MARKKPNKVLDAFEELESDIEANAPPDDEPQFDAVNPEGLTDEEVVSEMEQMSAQQRAAVQRSRQRGKVGMRGRRTTTRATTAKALKRSRNPQVQREEFSWKPANSLDAPPPLPGMEQRWIRFELNGQGDAKNWTRKQRERWTPRLLSTVDADFAPPTIKHAQLGDLIGVGDVILCHRPAAIGASRRKFFAAKTARQQASAERRAVDQVNVEDHPIVVRSRRDRPTVGVGTRRRAQAQE